MTVAAVKLVGFRGKDATDRAMARSRYASATPRERARAGVLLQRAGFTGADVARGVALLAGEAPAEGAPDDVTRKRARVLLRGAR